MTQEEKAKRYDELLLKLQKAKVDDNVCDERYCCVIDDIVPELKESEDEKIRKGIIRNLEYLMDRAEGFVKDELKERISWLEKQGTRPRYNIGDVICDKSCTTLNKEAQPNMEIVDIKNGMYICDKGSFPVSQQDEYVLVGKKIDSKLNDNSVSNELRAASFAHAKKEILNHTFPNNEEFELAYTFEKGAKWDAAQKPTWSKDDDDNIGMIESRLIDLLSYTRKDNSLTKRRKNSIEEEVVVYINWLTSLKDRYTWKPSDEQMDALDGICSYIRNKADWEISQDMVSDLYKLSEQLKKLK